jgi:hypothetical protein
MPIREHFEYLMENFPGALSEPFKEHPLARRISHDLSEATEEVISDQSYKVTGSAGRWSRKALSAASTWST